MKPELEKFIQAGEASTEFSVHLNYCESCRKAVDEAFTRQARAFEALAQEIQKQKT
ncbi:MAG: hypothetical protein AAB568_04065 [Patescibacteria group bacterium]